MADKHTYQEWREKAAKVKSIIADNNLAKWQKAHLAGGVLVGLELNGLQPKHRRKFISAFGQINSILKNYQLDTFDDYQKMTSDDLGEIIRLLETLTQPN